MGYGKKAISLLRNYYEGKFTQLGQPLDEDEDSGMYI